MRCWDYERRRPMPSSSCGPWAAMRRRSNNLLASRFG
jgi:hypothetical protein